MKASTRLTCSQGVSIFLTPLVLMWLWNWILLELFPLAPEISYWQAFFLRMLVAAIYTDWNGNYLQEILKIMEKK